MAIAESARIHPTAVIPADADIGANVEIGAFAVLEGKMRIGPDCVIRPGAYLFGDVTMGQGNQVFSGAVIGDKPQHIRYNNEPTSVEIGDFNQFREGVTVHRGTTASMTTRIGSNNFFMANAHVAHDCVVGNRCIFANGALMGGHCVVGDNVFMSGNTAIQQFVRVGRLAMLSGCAASTKDVPPFVVQQNFNTVCGINVIGMRRAGLTNADINAVKKAFNYIFRSGFLLPTAIQRMNNELGEFEVIQEMIEFLQNCPKGINRMGSRFNNDSQAAAA